MKLVAAAVTVLAALVALAPARGQSRDKARPAAAREETLRVRGRGDPQPGTVRGDAAERAAIAARASRLIGERRYEEALRILVPASERFPDDQRLVELLSTVYLRSGRPLEAIRILETRLGKTPDRFVFVRDLGKAFLEAGMPERAVAAWHSILGEGEGRSVHYYIEVARLEWNAGMYERALATLREGRRFPAAAARCTAEIVRLERLRGNYRAAFIAGLEGLFDGPPATLAATGPLVASFREAGRPPDLPRAVDSLAAMEGGNAPLLRMLHTMLLLERGDAAGVARFLETVRRGGIDERELYQFADYLLAQPVSDEDGAYEQALAQLVEVFLERHGRLPMAAKVLLEASRRAARLADAAGPGWREAARRSVALADSVLRHPAGRPFAQQASLLKARVLLEHGADPDAALAALAAAPRSGTHFDLEAERIRLEAVLAAGRWEEARRHFELLAGSPDSVLAAMGRYGAGMIDFYNGAFEAALESLAALAEEAPWSEWANDALATAVMLRQASREGYGPAGLLAAGLSAARAGRLEAALDSLDVLAGDYPESVLAPRAIFESALLLARAGREDEARERLERIAERYPLDMHAPRALEKLALLLEHEQPAAAARWYVLLLERYPRDPWVARARDRYMRLQALIERGEANGKDGA